LHAEHVGELAVDRRGPYLLIVGDSHEPRCDADALPIEPQRALHDKIDAVFSAEFGDRQRRFGESLR